VRISIYAGCLVGLACHAKPIYTSPEIRGELLNDNWLGDSPQSVIVVLDHSIGWEMLSPVCDDWYQSNARVYTARRPQHLGGNVRGCFSVFASLCLKTFHKPFLGFAGVFRPSQLAFLSNNCLYDKFQHIELDSRVISQSLPASTKVETCLHHCGNESCTHLWNLDRLDQRTLPLDGYFYRTRSSSNDVLFGAGVNVYGTSCSLLMLVSICYICQVIVRHPAVLDSGIQTSHREFEDPRENKSRAYTCWNKNSTCGTDCAGHGTHVAGIVGMQSPHLKFASLLCITSFLLYRRSTCWRGATGWVDTSQRPCM